MDEGKILVVNLSKGRIGEENMRLLGGMLIARLQMAAMERVDMPEDERRDFYLFVDEFQKFRPPNPSRPFCPRPAISSVLDRGASIRGTAYGRG